MADGSPLGAPTFDWRNPDYDAVFAERIVRLQRLRADPGMIKPLKAWYGENPGDLINDWGMTFDPRNVERSLPARIPFVLFPKQHEFCAFMVRKWRASEPGLVEKSRDMGMSWLVVGAGAAMCVCHDGFSVGYGSRKEEYVDHSSDPKSLFWKAREFIAGLPSELRGGWTRRKECSAHMRLTFPETGSTMTGEAGDNIGRGDRASIYMVDEAAHLERPMLIEASLSQTTNCRIDLSSVNGLGNPFEQKRHGGKIEVFIFDWRDDPRKDDAWYQKQVDELDPVVLAQEVNRDYSASVEGVLIPSAWARSAIDAHLVLGLKITGKREGALDVADQGVDSNAYCGAHGIVIEHLSEWRGTDTGDIYATVEKAFQITDALGYTGFRYDADGLGAGVRGDARKINQPRARKLEVTPFTGSGALVRPKGQDEPGRLNEDFFQNLKAQGWWSLRQRFRRTHRLVEEVKKYGKVVNDFDPDMLISISSDCTNHLKLVSELSQPTYSFSEATGKMVVDKKPDGSRSPNLADSVMIRFSPLGGLPKLITGDALGQI